MPKNQPPKYIRFIGAGAQMGVVIFVFYKLGEYVDTKVNNPNGLFLKIGTLLGVFLAIFMIIREALKLGKDNED